MIVALQGGLANQLFQAAFGLSLELVRNENVLFTRFRVDADRKRSYSLDTFEISRYITFTNKESEILYYDSGRYDANVYTTAPDTTFVGYWQTEKFFKEPLIRSMLKLRQPIADLTLLVSTMMDDRSVAVHIRRGDYISEPGTQNFHGNLPMGYYQKAIRYIQERVEGAKFFIFSDDPEYCRQVFPNDTIVAHNTPGNGQHPGAEAQDLYLMSLCQHAIIANSAFSWWGAYWGDTKSNRIVIAPEKWFNNPNVYSGDIVPDRWVKM